MKRQALIVNILYWLKYILFDAPWILLHIIAISLKRSFRDKRLLWAASLTYTTIFSLIPLLSVVFFLFKVFGAFTDLDTLVRPYVYKTLAPGAQENVLTIINDLVSSINFSTIGVLGTTVLIISVIILLSEIECALNEVWMTSNKRSFFYRVAIYWTSLTVGPLLLAIAIVISATLQSSKAVKVVEMYINLDFFSWLPYFLVWIAFTGLYVFMPSARVKLKSALLGGFIAGTLWHCAGSIFAWYTSNFVFYYPKVYGPLAAIPLFLLWIFISWILFLLGAEIAYHHEHYVFYRTVSNIPQLTTQDREHLTLRILFFIAKRFLNALPAPSLYMVADFLNIPVHLAEEFLAPLLKHGILLESSRNHRNLAFSRDLDTIKLSEILEIIRRETILPPSYYEDTVGLFLKNITHLLDPRVPSGIEEKSLKELLLAMDSGLFGENT